MCIFPRLFLLRRYRSGRYSAGLSGLALGWGSHLYAREQRISRGERANERYKGRGRPGPHCVCILFFFGGVLYVMYENSGILSYVDKEAVTKGGGRREGCCFWCILARNLAGNGTFEFKRSFSYACFFDVQSGVTAIAGEWHRRVVCGTLNPCCLPLPWFPHAGDLRWSCGLGQPSTIVTSSGRAVSGTGLPELHLARIRTRVWAQGPHDGGGDLRVRSRRGPELCPCSYGHAVFGMSG